MENDKLSPDGQLVITASVFGQNPTEFTIGSRDIIAAKRVSLITQRQVPGADIDKIDRYIAEADDYLSRIDLLLGN